MQDDNQHQMIGSSIGKLLRETFGKGPETVYVTMSSNYITVYLRNFISPPERVLLEQDQIFIVHQMRDKLMETVMPLITALIEEITGNSIREFYYDWNLHDKTGMLVGISSGLFQQSELIDESYGGKQELEREIVRISHLSQKAPDEISSCEVSPRTIIVIRNGILVRIEKELIRAGLQDTLKTVKRNLEKSYLHNNGHLETILGRMITDVFVDWDFDHDRSIIVILMNSKRPSVKNSFEEVKFI